MSYRKSNGYGGRRRYQNNHSTSHPRAPFGDSGHGKPLQFLDEGVLRIYRKIAREYPLVFHIVDDVD
jgi:hypothetical protein